MNYELLMKFTRDIPFGLSISQKKEDTTKELRQLVAERDKKTCQICGLVGEYGNPHWGIIGKLAIHHIIPNGKANLENLVTLCKYCHNAVHLLLYAEKKWRYVPMR